jgi:hypothetical protein
MRYSKSTFLSASRSNPLLVAQRRTAFLEGSTWVNCGLDNARSEPPAYQDSGMSRQGAPGWPA